MALKIQATYNKKERKIDYYFKIIWELFKNNTDIMLYTSNIM